MYSCKLHFVFFFSIWIVGLQYVTVASQPRTMSSPDKNPGCPKDKPECNETWIVQVKGKGENDTLHHMWGTVGAPTLMMAVTDHTTKLEINWENLFNGEEGSVAFSNDSEVHYAFGFVISDMILFNDVNDTGEIEGIPDEYRDPVAMEDFTWTIKDNITGQQEGVVFETVSFRNELLPNDTKISLKVVAFGSEGRYSKLPHLLNTANSAQIELTLDNLIMNFSSKADTFSKPRWAVNVVMFSMEEAGDVGVGFKYSTKKSLDDEYTPGVFNIDDVTTKLSRDNKKGGYLQWRPVCYTSPDRDISNSTFTHINGTFTELQNLDGSTNKSLAYAVFGEDLVKTLVSTKTVISFGQAKDGFYTEFNYTVWTLGYGVGSPPEDTFSSLIIIIISLGIGIPGIVFLVGGIFLGYRRCQG